MPLPNPTDPRPQPYLPWIIRRVEVLRGKMTFTSECAPSFNYGRSEHMTSISEDRKICHFSCSSHINLDLRYTSHKGTTDSTPNVDFSIHDLSHKGFKGPAIKSQFSLSEGQVVTFILSQTPSENATSDDDKDLKAGESNNKNENSFKSPHDPYLELDHYTLLQSSSRADPNLDFRLTEKLLESTQTFWLNWVSKMTYRGRWREVVMRSALTLKLLTFSPTGAIVASPSFSLPEDLNGAGRNW